MAEVIFMTGVDDVLDYAGRLIRKKFREGARLAVYGPTPVLRELDRWLWQHDPLDFLPHQLLASGEEPQSAALLTPIWLLASPVPAARCSLAVNLGRDDLDFVQWHERVAEIVGQDALARQAGRIRWKSYEAQGHTLKHAPQTPLSN
jgi:DNA polymerase III subunit chi